MNILLTSVGRRSYIVDYFKEALASEGRIIATNSAYTHALSRADAFFISPIIYSEEYIPFIVNLCESEKIDAVLSLFDIDLPVLAKNKSLFEAVGARFVGPSYEAALIGNDKLKTCAFFNSIGLKTPRTYTNDEEALALIRSGELSFPLVVKPRWGMGSISVNIARNEDELRIFYKKCVCDVESSYLKYESSADPEHVATIQEFITGQEHGLDIYKDLSGRFVRFITKKKIAMRSGETDIAEVIENAAFERFAETVAKNIDFTGVLDVDCFLAGGEIYGLEINPRVSGSYPFSHIAGANYPKQLIKWLKGEGTDPSLLNARVGVRGCKELTPTVLSVRG